MSSYENPMLTIDNTLFTVYDNELRILLVKRSINPYMGLWSLPGGFVDPNIDKSTEETAKRKLLEKSGVKPNYLEQLESFSGPNRDPRGFSVTLVYFALIGYQQASVHINTVDDAEWISINQLKEMELAFDHKKIIEIALQRLQQKTLYSMVPAFCLPELFTISDLKRVIEIIIEKPIQRKSLMRRVEASNMFEIVDEKAVTGKRQAQIYKRKPDVSIINFERNFSH